MIPFTRKLIVGGISILMMWESSLWACASCGSGGGDPLILYPNESLKILGSLGRSSGYRDIDSDGELQRSGGIQQKDVATFAAAARFHPRGFFSLAMPYVYNRADSKGVGGFGDLSLGARGTLVPQNMAEPEIPQVQLLVGYTSAYARSVYSSRDVRQLDVAGKGFAELRTGIDIWWGMSDWLGGTALTLSQGLPRTYSDMDFKPGLDMRWTLTGGYGGYSNPVFGHTLVGVNRERVAPIKVNGEDDGNVGSNTSVFFTQDAALTADDVLRLTFLQSGLGDSRSTTKVNSTTLAYMRTLL